MKPVGEMSEVIEALAFEWDVVAEMLSDQGPKPGALLECCGVSFEPRDWYRASTKSSRAWEIRVKSARARPEQARRVAPAIRIAGMECSWVGSATLSLRVYHASPRSPLILGLLPIRRHLDKPRHEASQGTDEIGLRGHDGVDVLVG